MTALTDGTAKIWTPMTRDSPSVLLGRDDRVVIPFGAVSACMSLTVWLRPVAHYHVLVPALFALLHLFPLSLATGAVHAFLVLQAPELPCEAASACTSPVTWPRPVAHFHVLAPPFLVFRPHSLSPFVSRADSSLAASGFSSVSVAVAMFSAPGHCWPCISALFASRRWTVYGGVLNRAIV